MRRTFAACSLIVGALLGIGCGGMLPTPAEPSGNQTTQETSAPQPPAPTNNPLIQAKRAGDRLELSSELRQLAQLAMIKSMTGEFPGDWDALIASDPQNRAFYEKLREADVVVVWKAPDIAKRGGAGATVFAYGPFAKEQGGPVAMMDGSVQQLSADELNAKLEAMGQ